MVMTYILMALGSVAVGVVLTLVIVGLSIRAGLDILENLWLLAIPAVLALSLNIVLLELHRKYRKRKH
jgi:general stress protein CsbA